jgi:hypothetical protein
MRRLDLPANKTKRLKPVSDAVETFTAGSTKANRPG